MLVMGDRKCFQNFPSDILLKERSLLVILYSDVKNYEQVFDLKQRAGNSRIKRWFENYCLRPPYVYHNEHP